MTNDARPETRGARLLRELERLYRSLSPEQRRSVIDALRDACEPRLPSPERGLPGSFADAAAGAA